MKLFSLIVPVYNVEKYLPECVDSIVAQMDEDCELILVDDGSTDSSGNLCDDYAQKNTLIRVIHQKNGGLSAARNAGLEVAGGEYLLLIDSDDFIAADTLNRLRDIIRQSHSPELILCRGYYFYPDGRKQKISAPYVEAEILGKSGIQTAAYLCRHVQSFFWGAYAAVYRNDFLKRYAFRFREGIVMEDMDWSFHLYPQLRKIAVMNRPYYYYRQSRHGSIMATVKLSHVLDAFSVCAELDQFYAALDIPADLKSAIRGKFGHLIASHAQKIPVLPPDDRSSAYAKLAELRSIVQASPHPRARIFAWLWRLLGMKSAVRILYSRLWLKRRLGK